jgi:2-polyprenyl-3-methyl-5-hydroxy-6-metoxy-1,4-benzoquinol methylase
MKNNPQAYLITRATPHFTVSRCQTCGHLYMDPPPTRAALEKMYGREYYAGSAAYSYTDERKNARGFQAVAHARIRKLLALLGAKSGAGRSFLDIGCSFGSLLDAARTAGFRTAGLDISPYALAHVRKQGHRALKGAPETARIGTRAHDIVTMVEVIEHLLDPVTALRRIHAALKPDGILLIQTPTGRPPGRTGGADYHYFLPGICVFLAARLTAQWKVRLHGGPVH